VRYAYSNGLVSNEAATAHAALVNGLATLRDVLVAIRREELLALRRNDPPARVGPMARDGEAARTRTRARANDATGRHQPSNTRSVGSGKFPPVQGGPPRSDGPPPSPTSEAPPPPQPPARPDPSDPATEVWTLVELAQGGDAGAFGKIYDRYVDTVFRFVYFRVGNRQLAEDLTSDTFLRALKRIGSFTWQGRDLGAWLVTIARNLVADHFKSGRYRLEVTTGDVLDADREDRGPEASPEVAVVDHITNIALLTAVKQLNPEQQECIVLRFLQGFSVAETAQAMGKNEGAIKALQYRAVRALARLLPDGFQP
jgi:RNA polymerase sigma-70 factor (ECF subfamily)